MNKEELMYLKEELNNQDYRATDKGIFCLMEKMVYPTTSDYSYDISYWLTEEGYIADSFEEARNELYVQTDDKSILNKDEFELEEEYGLREGFFFEVDVFVQAFLTEKMAKEYLESNKYNLNKPFIYVKSLYRNYEMQNIVEYFKEE